MKSKTLFGILMMAVAALAMSNCAGTGASPALKINTPAVQAQVIGDVEKDLLAGGGALLISGGNTGATVAAMSAQEVQNIPQLQAALDAANANSVAPKQPVAVTP